MVEEDAQFYLAEIIIALEALHGKEILSYLVRKEHCIQRFETRKRPFRCLRAYKANRFWIR